MLSFFPLFSPLCIFTSPFLLSFCFQEFRPSFSLALYPSFLRPTGTALLSGALRTDIDFEGSPRSLSLNKGLSERGGGAEGGGRRRRVVPVAASASRHVSPKKLYGSKRGTALELDSEVEAEYDL